METKEEKVPVEIDDSRTLTFRCIICMEYRPKHSHFCYKGCLHYFWFNCIVDHISYRVIRGDIPVHFPEPGSNIGEPMRCARCGCLFCYACAEMSLEKEKTALMENQQMEEDGKLIQESLRGHQYEQQNVVKADT
uniref:RING-type domain-containing protein n=1 Tax=Oryza punctata TaxID=4537 RepID=A0A0E0MEV2_ORYPU